MNIVSFSGFEGCVGPPHTTTPLPMLCQLGLADRDTFLWGLLN